VYFNHGLLADAVAETEAALEADPDDVSLQSILARLYSQVGRTAEAAALYDKILEDR
jgi:Tfp pilus assembly protein PilF